MFALLILPILVTGFIVISINPYQKLKLHRYDGQLLYLKAAKIGLRYFIAVTCICIFLKDQTFNILIPSQLFVDGEVIQFKTISLQPSPVTILSKKLANIENKRAVTPELIEISWLLILSLITIVSAYVLSCWLSFLVRIKDALSVALYGSATESIFLMKDILKDSPIDYIFYESFISNKPILVSMKSRKLYIGMVNKLGEPSESEEPNQEISLIPAISGYRKKDTLKVVLQNNYSLPKNIDSSIIIKVDEIDSVSWFNYQYYLDINGNIESTDSSSSKDPEEVSDKCTKCRERTRIKVGSFSIVKD